MRTSAIVVALVYCFSIDRSASCRAALPVLSYRTIEFYTSASNNRSYMSDGVRITPPPVFPYQATFNESVTPSYSNNVVDLSINGDQYVFSIDLIHQSDGPGGIDLYPTARTAGYLSLTPTQDTPIEVSGFYNITDFADGSRVYAELNATVTDVTGRVRNFENYQTVAMTPNAHLTVCEAGGDWPSGFGGVLNGSPKSMLLAGHLYVIDFEMSITTSYSEEYFPGASALGEFTIKLGGPIVPEPCAVTIITVFAMFLPLIWRFRARQFIRIARP